MTGGRRVDGTGVIAVRAWAPRLAAALTLAGLAVAGASADRYTAATLSRILVIGLLAASVALLAGWCGLPSLGQTAPFAVGAYTTGLLAKHVGRAEPWAGAHPVVAGPILLLAAAVAGAVFAAVTGPVVLRTRGTVFLMVSLAVGELVATAAARWTGLTGGSDGLLAIPATRAWPGSTPLLDPRHSYLYVLTVSVVVALTTVLVLRSPAGMLLRATRDNEPRLRAAGHATGRYLYLAYIGAGAVAAVGGSLLVTVQRYVSPADVGFDLSALVLLAVVVGGANLPVPAPNLRSIARHRGFDQRAPQGRGGRILGADARCDAPGAGSSLVGAFAGAALIVGTRDWLAGPWPGHAPLLVGTLLIVAVYVLPTGVAGLPARLRRVVDGRVP